MNSQEKAEAFQNLQEKYQGMGIERAREQLQLTTGYADLEIRRAQAALDCEMKLADIAKRWIEVTHDATRLAAMRKALQSYNRSCYKLEREVKQAKRKVKRIERFASQASFILHGQHCPQVVKGTVFAALQVLFREFRVTSGLETLHRCKANNEIPDIGSVDYVTLVNAIDEIAKKQEEMTKEKQEEIDKLQSKLAEMQSQHWKQFEIF